MAETKINKNQVGAGIYTQDNLIAGKDISLTDVSDIDSNTMMLMHFNESLSDSSQYNATLLQKTTGGTTWTAIPTYQDGKFGKALKTLGASISSPEWTNTAFSQINDEMTVDFWFYYDPNQNQVCNFKIYSGSHSASFEIYFYQNQIRSYLGGKDGSYSHGLSSQQLVAGAWNHVALCLKSNNSAYLFTNGKLTSTTTTAYEVLNFSSGISRILVQSGYMQLDELRISKVIRWTQDFTLPTAEYGQPTGQKKINNTMSEPSVMTGATSSAAGTSGLVPAPAAGDQAKYLTGAGTWQTVDALQNTSTGTNSLTILGTANTYTNSTNIGSSSVVYNSYTTAIGMSATCYGSDSTAIGTVAQTNGQGAVAIGYNAKANAQNAIQIGTGTNSTASSVQIGSYQVFDRSTGKIPMARLPIVQCTQAEYDALVQAGTVDANTLYFIIPGSN